MTPSPRPSPRCSDGSRVREQRPSRAAMRAAALCGTGFVLLAGCRTPLSTLNPAGPAAEMIASLWWGMLGGAALISLLLLGLILTGWRARGAGPSLAFWIYGAGIGFTLAILFLVVGAGLLVGERLQPARKPAQRDGTDASAISILAEARQWEWRFHHSRPDAPPVILSELYIPAGAAVDIRVTSLDVVHSFWVPRLAGKMDAFPGRENLIRIEASQPGRYQGRSAEFSGEGYGDMRFDLIAYPPDNPPAVLRPLFASEAEAEG